jgi:hypothetical protein
MSAFGGKADMTFCTANVAYDPKQTFWAFQTISQSTSDKPVDQMTDAEITVRT